MTTYICTRRGTAKWRGVMTLSDFVTYCIAADIVWLDDLTVVTL